jgi:hypothetical protein
MDFPDIPPEASEADRTKFRAMLDQAWTAVREHLINIHEIRGRVRGALEATPPEGLTDLTLKFSGSDLAAILICTNIAALTQIGNRLGFTQT